MLDILVAAGPADRCECVALDFFDGAPAGGDAYVMSRILHDWNDEQCVRILTNCRRVVPPHGGLLEILVMTPAKERTEADYARLFEKSRFEDRPQRRDAG